jgi:hypothetical protein
MTFPKPQHMVSCPDCGAETTLDAIHQISDKSETPGWHRVKMGCGHENTMRADDAEDVAAVAAGHLACVVFPDPDSDQFKTVFMRRRLQ